LNFIGQIDKVAVAKSKGIVNASRLIDKSAKGFWKMRDGREVRFSITDQAINVHKYTDFWDLFSTFLLCRLLLCFACIRISAFFLYIPAWPEDV